MIGSKRVVDSILILTDDTVVCKVFALETQANNWGEPTLIVTTSHVTGNVCMYLCGRG